MCVYANISKKTPRGVYERFFFSLPQPIYSNLVHTHTRESKGEKKKIFFFYRTRTKMALNFGEKHTLERKRKVLTFSSGANCWNRLTTSSSKGVSASLSWGIQRGFLKDGKSTNNPHTRFFVIFYYVFYLINVCDILTFNFLSVLTFSFFIYFVHCFVLSFNLCIFMIFNTFYWGELNSHVTSMVVRK